MNKKYDGNNKKIGIINHPLTIHKNDRQESKTATSKTSKVTYRRQNPYAITGFGDDFWIVLILSPKLRAIP
jgi:hypothetical protein